MSKLALGSASCFMADDKRRLFLLAKMIPVGLVVHEMIVPVLVRLFHETMHLKTIDVKHLVIV
jgi:hypothetical protein